MPRLCICASAAPICRSSSLIWVSSNIRELCEHRVPSHNSICKNMTLGYHATDIWNLRLFSPSYKADLGQRLMDASAWQGLKEWWFAERYLVLMILYSNMHARIAETQIKGGRPNNSWYTNRCPKLTGSPDTMLWFPWKAKSSFLFLGAHDDCYWCGMCTSLRCVIQTNWTFVNGSWNIIYRTQEQQQD